MNESILKALMQLFAIIAHVDENGLSPDARKLVEAYLSLLLSKDKSQEYLQLFDDFTAKHHRKSANKKRARQRLSANSVRVLAICEEINEQLHQEEKLITLVRLFEFINEDNVITEEEEDFVKTVSDVFNLTREEYAQVKAIVVETIEKVEDKNRVLIIDSEDRNDYEYKHISEKLLDGVLQILHIKSTNTFLFKYQGSDTLFLNSHNILPNRTYVFDSGAIIKSPKISPVYYSDVAGKFIETEGGHEIFFKAEAIEFRYGNSDNGIHNFDFCEKSGRLVGIMGGSGVGKSTLLNIFNGNYPLKSGKITINGYDLHEDKETLEGVIGFVPQDDLLIDELTVYQNLYFNAKLCFSKFSDKKINEIVEKVLSDLDLTATRDLTVGSPLNKFISGGQRKRLNVGLELLREPSILIVDEPTSGLSSMDSEMIMNLLKEQTLKGKLVIVNIHQPSSEIYKLFDSLLMMDKGGHPVYYGNPLEAIRYFKEAANYVNADEGECNSCGNVNPEQPLQILEAKMVDEHGKFTKERKISPKEWYSAFKEKIEPKRKARCEGNEKTELPTNYFKVPSVLKQFLIFTKRNILSKLTNKQFLLITFLEAPVLAFFLAYFTKYIAGTVMNSDAYVFSKNENLPAYIFMAVTVAMFIGLTVSAEEIIKDRKILKREKFLNLSRFSYLNSKIIVLFLISAVQTLSFVLVGNMILGIENLTFTYWAVLFTTAAFSNIVGLNISASLNSVVTIYIVIPFILVPQLLFSGTIVDFAKLHKVVASQKYVPFIGDIMTSRWANEALMVAQFKDNNYEKLFFEQDKKISEASFKNEYLLPKIEEKLSKSLKEITNKKTNSRTESSVEIVKNELLKLEILDFDKSILENLSVSNLNEDISKKIKKHIKNLKRKYSKEMRIYRIERDKIKKEYDKNAKVRAGKLLQTSHNKQVADVVKNRKETIQSNYIKEVDGELIQISDPIYKTPESTIGRAHLYAPVKKLGNWEIDTVWFNIAFIWFTALLVYLLLVFDIVRKLLNIRNKYKY